MKVGCFCLGYVLIFILGFLSGKYLCLLINKILNSLSSQEKNFNLGHSSLDFPIRCLTSFIIVLCFYKFGLNVYFLLTFMFLCSLVIIFVVDLYFMIIPDEIIFFLCALDIIFWIRNILEIDFRSRLYGGLIICLLMLLTNSFVNNSFGFGDIKLFGVSGFILGWKNNLLAFLISIISASIVSCYLILTKKKGLKGYIAFGPFICIGVAIAFFWGHKIIDLYLDTILF